MKEEGYAERIYTG